MAVAIKWLSEIDDEARVHWYEDNIWYEVVDAIATDRLGALLLPSRAAALLLTTREFMGGVRWYE